MVTSRRARWLVARAFVSFCLCGLIFLPAEAQTTQDDKAKAVLQAAIEALGGKAYLEARDVRSEGRAFQFDRFEELNGMARFTACEKFPDKERQELGKDKDVIFVLNGDNAWEKDFHGVRTYPADEVERLRYGRLLSVDRILRVRMNEPGVMLRYAGTEMVNHRRADLVEFEDGENHAVIIAFEQDSHLPVRREYTLRNPKTKLKQTEVETIGNYRRVGAIQAPYYRMRERDGQKIFEVFFSSVQFNMNLPDSLFERPPGRDRPEPGRKKN